MAPVRKVLEGETVQYTTESHGLEWENWILPIRGAHGEVAGAVGITLDISQRKHTEQELRAQLDLVTRQQQVIRELSTPIIEVWDRVLTLPMVGVIDSARTAEVMDSLLEAVVRARARFAVLDLTGVEAVDTQTAAYLFELVRAIRLLGADGIITGIRPTVAQTVVALGLDLTSITTLSNLRAGLKYCILQMSREQGGGEGTGGGAGAGRGGPSRGEGPRAKAERPAQLAGRSSPPGRRWA
jgi:rsbT co-antagonist protein RsbR